MFVRTSDSAGRQEFTTKDAVVASLTSPASEDSKAVVAWLNSGSKEPLTVNHDNETSVWSVEK